MFITAFGFLAAACAHVSTVKPDTKDSQYINHLVVNELKTSSLSIQQALNALNASNTVRYGDAPMPFADINDPVLAKKLSLTYYGPLKNVLIDIAKSVGYKVQIFGKKPPFSVVIIIGKLNVPEEDSAINILRDIAVQAGKQTTININPKAKVISVRYAQIWQ